MENLFWNYSWRISSHNRRGFSELISQYFRSGVHSSFHGFSRSFHTSRHSWFLPTENVMTSKENKGTILHCKDCTCSSSFGSTKCLDDSHQPSTPVQNPADDNHRISKVENP